MRLCGFAELFQGDQTGLNIVDLRLQFLVFSLQFKLLFVSELEAVDQAVDSLGNCVLNENLGAVLRVVDFTTQFGYIVLGGHFSHHAHEDLKLLHNFLVYTYTSCSFKY